MLKHIEMCESTQKEVNNGQYRNLEGAYTFNQTNGIGRRGTEWKTEPNKSIAFSYIYGGQREHAMSIHIGIELAKLFQSEGLDIEVKWPNDIYYKEEKVAGILIDRIFKGNVSYYVIGIGFNFEENEFGHIPLSKDKALKIANKMLQIDHEAPLDIDFFIRHNYLKKFNIIFKGDVYDTNFLNIDGTLEIGSGEIKHTLNTDLKTKMELARK